MTKPSVRVIPMEQNSEEWLEFRRGRSGGSEFGDLYIPGLPLKSELVSQLEAEGKLPEDHQKKTAQELADLLSPKALAALKLKSGLKMGYYEIVAGNVARPITPNDYVERLNGEPFSMMARGHLLEYEALQAFSKRFKKCIHPQSCVWVKDGNERVYISPDGIICTEQQAKEPIEFFVPTEAAEVKCLGNTETVKAYLTGEYPQKYKAQVVKYFIVNPVLKTLYFILYTDAIPGLELQVWEIHREDLVDEIAEAEAYENAVMELVEIDVQKIGGLGF